MSQLYVVMSADSSSFTAECDYLAHRFGNAADPHEPRWSETTNVYRSPALPVRAGGSA